MGRSQGHGITGLLPRLDQPGKRHPPNQRHIARDHQNTARKALQSLRTTLHRVPGALLLSLLHPFNARIVTERPNYVVLAVANHHHNLIHTRQAGKRSPRNSASAARRSRARPWHAHCSSACSCLPLRLWLPYRPRDSRFFHQNRSMPLSQPVYLHRRGATEHYPARTRTWNARTKTWCVTDYTTGYSTLPRQTTGTTRKPTGLCTNSPRPHRSGKDRGGGPPAEALNAPPRRGTPTCRHLHRKQAPPTSPQGLRERF